ncbi:hypothetical protein LEMLEM_LOCUS27645 [Lemmus lemmus]
MGHPEQHQAHDSKEQVPPRSANGGHPQGQCHPAKPEACGGGEETDPSHQELLSPTPQKQ